MFCDVLAACVAVGHTRVVTPDEVGADAAHEAGAEVVADPGGGQGPAVQAGLEGVEPDGILVVNADVPCVVPHDLRWLLAATPAGCLALVEALDGTTNALSLPAARCLRAALRPQQLRPLPRARRLARPRRRFDRRAQPRRRRRHHGRPRATAAARRPTHPGVPAGAREEHRLNVTVLSGGVGGARFIRGVVDVAGGGFDERGRQRRRRRRGARPARLAGSRLDPLRARRPRRRAARLGAERRDLAGARDGRLARWRGLVRARRPRSRAPSRADAGAAGGRAAFRGHRSARRGVRRFRAPAAGDRRPAAHLARDARRRIPVPGVVRRARPPGRGRRRAFRRGGSGAARRPACSTRLPRPI